VPSNKEYEKQRKIWYAKLKREGFTDIEDSETSLKQSSSTFYADVRRWTPAYELFRAKADYYYAANHFLTSHKFDSELEKIIWEYHSNGISIRNIVKTLAKAKQKADRNSVWATIKKLRSIMRGF